MAKIKILVVDDSAFMRKVIKDILETDPNLEVVGTAKNGQDALDKIPDLMPDVVTLDVEMPVLDGLDTLNELVGKYKLPVIMLSSTTQVGAENTVIALERGAFDFIPKPSGSISLDLHKVGEELVTKVHLAFKYGIGRRGMNLSTTQSNRNSTLKKETKPITQKTPSVHLQPWKKEPAGEKVDRTQGATDTKLKNVVLIGTSTGGPKALQQVLSNLPRFDHTAVLVVQHMPPGFTLSLAKRLDQLSAFDISEAKDGDLIKGGHIYIAPGGYHMRIRNASSKLVIQLGQDPPKGGHRPSVDLLFESAEVITHQNLYSVVMTGMGKDGTEGLKKLQSSKKVYSISEDESSCVVYGMPRAVYEAKLIHEVVPLDQIHEALKRLLKE